MFTFALGVFRKTKSTNGYVVLTYYSQVIPETLCLTGAIVDTATINSLIMSLDVLKKKEKKTDIIQKIRLVKLGNVIYQLMPEILYNTVKDQCN